MCGADDRELRCYRQYRRSSVPRGGGGGLSKRRGRKKKQKDIGKKPGPDVVVTTDRQNQIDC